VLFTLVSGARRGLIRQVFEVVGIIAAFIGAFFLAHLLAAYLEPRLGFSYHVSVVISAVILFVGIIIGVHFLALAASKLINMTVLGSFDKIMGGIFGAVKGILISSLLLIILFAIPLPGGVRSELKNDPVVRYVKPVLPVLFDAVMSIGSDKLDFDKVLRSRDYLTLRAGRPADDAEAMTDGQRIIDSALLPSPDAAPVKT
jgi:membrane protein required for colicin V production